MPISVLNVRADPPLDRVSAPIVESTDDEHAPSPRVPDYARTPEPIRSNADSFVTTDGYRTTSTDGEFINIHTKIHHICSWTTSDER
jgi:hypothetical protein